VGPVSRAQARRASPGCGARHGPGCCVLRICWGLACAGAQGLRARHATQLGRPWYDMLSKNQPAECPVGAWEESCALLLREHLTA
jgi:hypothetical protein